MAIFISYAHSDAEFVDRLAANLVLHRRNVWVDRWELRVGDSILNRIESAIHDATALIVVISNASVGSEWCKKEITAGLLRELEERQVVVLPLLLDDCSMPLFLRDKLYADFRTDFDSGMRSLLEATAGVTSDAQGRFESPEFHVDWAMDWLLNDQLFLMKLTFVQHDAEHPYCVLTEFEIVANEESRRRQLAFYRADLDWAGRLEVVEALKQAAEANALRVVLEDNHAQQTSFELQARSSPGGYLVNGSTRWIGEDVGKDVVVDISSLFLQLAEHERRGSRELSPEEYERVLSQV